MNSAKISAVDIGNSRLKMLIGGDFFAFNYDEGWENQVISLLCGADSPELICISSVNVPAKDALARGIENYERFRLVYAEDLLNSSGMIDYSNVAGMGDDRKLGLAGALGIVEPPLITVDCGTAITINVIDEKCVCRGGSIFPGLNIQLAGLHNHTSQLPEVEFKGALISPGLNTIDAIGFGISSSITGGIVTACSLIAGKLFGGEMPNVILTGGHAGLFLDPLKSLMPGIIYEANLVLLGLIELYENR